MRLVVFVQAVGTGQLVDQVDAVVIAQIRADLGRVVNNRDTQRFQMVRRTDAGKHHQLGRSDRAGGDQHFALGRGGHFVSGMTVAHGLGAAVLDHDARHLAIGLDGEVLPVLDRLQIGDSGRTAPRVAGRRLIDAGPALLRAVEIRIVGHAILLAGLHKDLAHLLGRLQVRDAERSLRVVPLAGQRVIALGAQEIGLHLLE